MCAQKPAEFPAIRETCETDARLAGLRVLRPFGGVLQVCAHSYKQEPVRGELFDVAQQRAAFADGHAHGGVYDVERNDVCV